MGVQFQQGYSVGRRQLRLRRRMPRPRNGAVRSGTDVSAPMAPTPDRVSSLCWWPSTTSFTSRSPTTSTVARTTSSRGKRTSTSATATSSFLRCRRRRAPALHTVDVPTDRSSETYFGIDPVRACSSPPGRSVVTVPTSTPCNPTFVDIGGSPYEGHAEARSCDTKLVPLANGRSIAPTFNVFTDVPLPGRFWGLLVDDLNFSSEPHQINYGEKAGVRFAPVGHLRLHEPARLHGRVRLQRPVRRADAVDQPDQLPDAVGCLRQRLPLRRQRPRHAGQPQRQLQPAVPHHRGRVRGDSRASSSRPTSHRRRSASRSSCPVVRPSRCSAPSSSAPRRKLFAVDKPYVIGAGPFTIKGPGFGAQATVPGVSWTRRRSRSTRGPTPRSLPACLRAGPFGPHQLSIRRSANGQTTVSGIHVPRDRSARPVGPFPNTGLLDNFNNTATPTGSVPDWTDELRTPASSPATSGTTTRLVSAPAQHWPTTRCETPRTARTRRRTSPSPSVRAQPATEQGLLLKFDGTNPNARRLSGSKCAQQRRRSERTVRFARSRLAWSRRRRRSPATSRRPGRSVSGPAALANGTVVVY